MDRLARFSLGRRALTALVTFAIAALGVFSMANLRQELIPSISFPAAAILGVYPGASPQVVEDQVTDVVELAVGGVGGVEEVSSTAASNISATTVLFEFGTDMDAAVQALRTAMDQVSGQLPEDVTPQIITGSIDQLPVVQLAAAGGIDDDTLADAVETTLVPRLERIDGVRGVSVAGAAEREILLDVNLPALIGAGLTPDSVRPSSTTTASASPPAPSPRASRPCPCRWAPRSPRSRSSRTSRSPRRPAPRCGSATSSRSSTARPRRRRSPA